MAPKQDPKPKFQEGESGPLGRGRLTAPEGGEPAGAGARGPRAAAGLCARRALYGRSGDRADAVCGRGVGAEGARGRASAACFEAAGAGPAARCRDAAAPWRRVGAVMWRGWGAGAPAAWGSREPRRRGRPAADGRGCPGPEGAALGGGAEPAGGLRARAREVRCKMAARHGRRKMAAGPRGGADGARRPLCAARGPRGSVWGRCWRRKVVCLRRRDACPLP